MNWKILKQIHFACVVSSIPPCVGNNAENHHEERSLKETDS